MALILYLTLYKIKGVLWPKSLETRVLIICIYVLVFAQGLCFKYLVIHNQQIASQLINGLVILTFYICLLIDFIPVTKYIKPPLSDNFPVSQSLNLIMAFLLDLISIRRLLLLCLLISILISNPQLICDIAWIFLAWLSGSILSFNLRLIIVLKKWNNILFGINILILLLISYEFFNFDLLQKKLAILIKIVLSLPIVFWCIGLLYFAPIFNYKTLFKLTEIRVFDIKNIECDPEIKGYLRKSWQILMLGKVCKIIILVIIFENTISIDAFSKSIFSFALLPAISFTYANNNLYGQIYSITTNHIIRLGMTLKLVNVYFKLVIPVVIIDSLISIVMINIYQPTEYIILLKTVIISIPSFLTIGLWGSLWRAKAVVKDVGFHNLDNHSSNLVSIITLGLSTVMITLPSWVVIWISLFITITIIIPLYQLIKNEAYTRNQLWKRVARC